jgi:hypothetical protein
VYVLKCDVTVLWAVCSFTKEVRGACQDHRWLVELVLLERFYWRVCCKLHNLYRNWWKGFLWIFSAELWRIVVLSAVILAWLLESHENRLFLFGQGLLRLFGIEVIFVLLRDMPACDWASEYLAFLQFFCFLLGIRCALHNKTRFTLNSLQILRAHLSPEIPLGKAVANSNRLSCLVFLWYYVVD